MKSPGEIKFELEERLLRLANGGKMPVITGLHSICCEGNTVHIGYDLILPDDASDMVWFFEFEKPAEVGRDALAEFSRWLSETGFETVH
jgi:hypothetical protein